MLDKDAMVWSAPEDQRDGRPLVVLLHGRYGTEHDMTQFFPALPADAVAVSLRGPVPWGDRWAWAPEWTADGAAAHQIRAVVDELLAWVTGLRGFGSISLVGFSQGGATSLLMLQAAPRQFAAVVQLCGFMAPEMAGPDDELRAVRPPVLNIRCGQDTAIPADLADYTSAWLRARTTLTELAFEELGHAITPELIAATADYLR
ncbi:phospholipase/Carboxylesterase [Kribbella flavida DSM 17836]|uniref:Phospholipase/Carboxylesterase n=2 Tax=Kribbella flavida TaxID=182640 RepID=D2PZQ3_KRIFD|nr:phospholipase/Carboxylesterase [Kribbella flavida DSM 17836]